jgi:hypothetical protein
MKMIQEGGMGAVTWESDEIAAAWQADDVKPDAAGGAAMPPVPPPVPDDASKPTTDKLPKFGEMPKPMVSRIGPVSRDPEKIPDLGKSPELIKALFEELGDGDLASRVYHVKSTTVGPDGREIAGGDAYVVVQLIERAKPDLATFTKDADQIVEQIEQSRGEDIVHTWLVTRCNELVEKKEIRIGNDVLVTKDDKGQTKQIAYGACSNL